MPPHWSASQWIEEMQAEGAAAALQAVHDFDPTRNVPLEAYVRLRVMGHVVTRYRKEWGLALRQAPGGAETEPAARPDADPRHELSAALDRLSEADRRLVRQLFWERRTEAELAGQLGISQQAISKRKRAVLRRLYDVLAEV